MWLPPSPPAETSCMAPEVVVVDASVVVQMLLGGASALPAGAVLVAPAHLDAEVLSALARLCRAGQLSANAVEDMLEGLAELPLGRVELPQLVRAAFELRDNLAQRDSLYVVLAQRLDAALLTLDTRLAAVCRQHQLCRVA
jgi:predicted nucleic acid-binding protein